MSKNDFLKASQRYSNWCKSALIFWHAEAADPRGGFAEHLQMDGTPDFDHVRRVRVQSRQAYVYAHAAHLGWYDNAQAASDHAWDFATGAGAAGASVAEPAGGYAHLVNGDGSLHDGLRDTYAQAFILLSAAWRYKAFDDKVSLQTARDTLAFLDQNLKAENGGWYESLPLPDSDIRRQNPHMHLFEACLALYEVTQDKAYLDRADGLFDVFKNHFFDSKSHDVLEFFNSDWSPAEDGGGPIEPGHMMEWCWLLRAYESLSGTDVGEYANALYNRAIASGLNPRTGLLYDAINLDGSIISPTHRTWPLTEWIKASVAQAGLIEDEEDLDVALRDTTQYIDLLFENYLDVTVAGGWVDKLDQTGDVISTNMPTSTFYHIFCAAVEVQKLELKLLEKAS